MDELWDSGRSTQADDVIGGICWAEDVIRGLFMQKIGPQQGSNWRKAAQNWSKVLQRGARQTPFYGFVHFAAFQMLAGVQFKVRMGKVSTEVLNCGRETSRVQK